MSKKNPDLPPDVSQKKNVGGKCFGDESDQDMNSENDINNKRRSDDDSDCAESQSREKRKRLRKASKVDKLMNFVVEHHKKREEEKKETRDLKQKRHEEKMTQSQQLIEILSRAFQQTETNRYNYTTSEVILHIFNGKFFLRANEHSTRKKKKKQRKECNSSRSSSSSSD